MKLMARVAKKIKIKKFVEVAASRPITLLIGKTETRIGKAQTNQLANILANTKISKLSQEVKICSIVPSSKSFFKNSAAEKIRQESAENQIIEIE